HMAEEIWELIGGEGFVSLAKWPSPDEMPSYPDAELSYNVVSNVLEDVRSVMSSGVKGEKLYLYLASDWKYDLFRRIEELREKYGLDPRKIIPEVMKEDKFKAKGKQTVELVRQFSTGGWPWLPTREQEFRAFEDARSYLERKLGVSIILESEENPSYDPKKRAGRAAPGRPAIYLE
ncbi:MAG: hypothetical protein J7L91_01530, partial [Candidatus Korarchaeota archaeon]|nr:hypothetical protein [Candidatus Korarchaeota archaeon]